MVELDFWVVDLLAPPPNLLFFSIYLAILSISFFLLSSALFSFLFKYLL